ncbi:MAG: DNA translocase FtsK 4TM domain-containing protein [Candidatus Moraniibacteriota bacterium]
MNKNNVKKSKEKKSNQDSLKKGQSEDSQKKSIKEPFLHGDAKKSIASVLLIVFALIFVLSLFGQAGIVGEYLDKFLRISFGWGRFVLPVLMVILGVVYFRKYQRYRYYLTTAGAFVFFLFLLVIFYSFAELEEMKELAKQGSNGGFLGFAIAYPLFKYFGGLAATILSAGFLLVGFILTFNFPLNKFFAGAVDYYKDFISKIKSIYSSRQEKGQQEEDLWEEDENKEKKAKEEDNIKEGSIKFIDEDETEEKTKTPGFGLDENDYGKKEKKPKEEEQWKFPSTDLLEDPKKRKHPGNLEKKAKIIQKTFEEFGVKVTFKGYHLGPSVVQYTFEPASGVKLSRITACQDNLALNLSSSSIRIEAPIPGKPLVGIEVPLPQEYSAEIRVKTSLESEEFKKQSSNLSIVLGEDIHGEFVFADIKKMPHLMVAGATNMGKSVCINTILTSLLYQNTPEDLKLILIDPKRVELNFYNGVPHLMSPVITDVSKVVNALKWVVNKMEERYEILEEAESKDIQSYNEKIRRGKKRQRKSEETGKYYYEDFEKMPYILIVIDELNDLMSTHGKEVEGLIVRLAQKARAVGIHLIVSTQKPSVDVITGQIKANITARIALKVSSQVDSRIILDRTGAEKLLGRGDMLFSSNEVNTMRRIQGAFVSDEETSKVVNFWKKQVEKDEDDELKESFKEELKKPGSNQSYSGSSGESEDLDEKFEDAKNLIVSTGKASTSLIQSRFAMGYQRANRIMMQLEDNGVVGPAKGSKPREILIGKQDNFYEDDEQDQFEREKWEKE